MTAVEDAWRAEPARIDLACAVYDALLQRHAGGQAAEVMREVLAHVPESIAAHFRLSECLVVLGDPAAAAGHLRRVVEAPVAEADDWLYRSLALARLGRRAESEASARHYLGLRPGHAHATFHVVSLLLDAGRFEESARLLGEAIERSGGGAAVLVSLVLRLRLVRPGAGDALLTRLAARCEGDAHGMLDLARLARAFQAPHTAAQFAARALAAPESPEARVYHDLFLPDVPESADDIRWWLDRYRANLEALRVRRLRLANPLSVFDVPPQVHLFLYAHGAPDLHAASARAWEAIVPDLAWTAPHCRTWRTRALDRRLRVGFLTTPEYPLLWGVARELDHRRFETVLLYDGSQGVPRAGAWADAVERRLPIPQTLEEARAAVASEELDVVISTPFRPLLYFLSYARLAPVQCILTEPAFTDGVANLDYYISWRPAEPRRLDGHYNVPVALLDRPPYWIEREHCRPEPLRREDFELPQDARWYVCPSTPLKLQATIDPLFADLLAADPGGVLVLLRREWQPTQAVVRRLRARVGSAADRLRVLPELPRERCHALLTLADAVLDTWPIGGMSSSFAGIHVAAPTVTLPADVPFGRWLTALYERIGVIDLIATDAADYVRLAVRLASSPEWRRDLSRRIAESGGILLEDRLAVRELETFLVAAVTAAHRREPRRDWIDGRFAGRRTPARWRRWLTGLRRAWPSGRGRAGRQRSATTVAASST